MRFNNFLNRLRASGIYTLIATTALTLILLVVVLLRALFYVEPPQSVFEAYIDNLQAQNFYSAERLITADQRQQWNGVFAEYGGDESAEGSLRLALWKQARWEMVSQSSLAEDHQTVRFLISAPDAEAILASVREAAESGAIDMGDPDVVRVARDAESTLLYYAEDHLDDNKHLLVQEEIVISFHLNRNFIDRAWQLEPSQELHALLAGYLPDAMAKVFSTPLDLPKS